jgi:hypothetical protein
MGFLFCPKVKEGKGCMTSVEGEILRNKATQDLFKIKKIERERMVMLEDEKGYVRIWLPKKYLGFFFEEVNPVTKDGAFTPPSIRS